MKWEEIRRSVEFFESISASVKLFVLFVLGVGGYRAVLFLLVFFFIKSIVDHKKKHIFLKVVFLPAFLSFVYMDYFYGHMWLSVGPSNLVFFFVCYLLIDYFGGTYVSGCVARVSRGFVFSCCPNCGYQNKEFVDSCANCEFGKNSNVHCCFHESKDVYSEDYENQDHVFKRKLNCNIIKNICLGRDEKIYISLKVRYVSGVYIDGRKYLCNVIAITGNKIVFLHSRIAQRGWRWREVVDLRSITQVKISCKKISVTERQIIEIDAGGRIYEFFIFSSNIDDDEFTLLAKHLIYTVNTLKANHSG